MADLMGAMRESLTLQRNGWPALPMSLTRAGELATGRTSRPHGYLTADTVTIAASGGSAGFAGPHKITVTGGLSFTFPCSAALPATAAGTVTYLSDPQRGRRPCWLTVATVPAAMVPIRGGEQLQSAAIRSSALYRFRIRARADVSAPMRALWVPSWSGGLARTLELTGPPLPVDDGRTYLELELAESAA